MAGRFVITAPLPLLPQCHLKFFSLVLQLLARQHPELIQPRACPPWRPPRRPGVPRWHDGGLPVVAGKVDETLVYLTAMLRHNQTIPALALSQDLALALG